MIEKKNTKELSSKLVEEIQKIANNIINTNVLNNISHG